MSSMSSKDVHSSMRQTYTARAMLPGTHPLAHLLFHLMCIKKSNLCLSADVTSTAQLMQLAEEVGDSICMIKTHADIIDDFGERTVKGLRALAAKKKFLVFEDRKLGDIGSKCFGSPRRAYGDVNEDTMDQIAFARP